MDDPLQVFRGGDTVRELGEGVGYEHELLLFEHGGVTYGVAAAAVDVVVAWQKPTPLPASLPGFAGVVQDRGRVVAVLATPMGRVQKELGSEQRLVICNTARGFLGLPCGSTRAVGPVVLAQPPIAGDTVDSSAGPFVYIDPEALLSELAGVPLSNGT